MSEHSAISWTDATWNCLVGCTRVSRGCDLCYAAQFAATRGKNTPTYKGLAVITPSGRPAFNGIIRILPHKLRVPCSWRSPRMIFVNSMSDLFHDAVPDFFIDQVFAIMAWANWHTYQVLTKRHIRMQAYWAGLAAMTPENRGERLARSIGEGSFADRIERMGRWPLGHIWQGVSVEDQAAADERIPLLLETPAEVRFISAEPLLGRINLGKVFDRCSYYCDHDEDGGGHRPERTLDWVIVGGESGAHHRPMEVTWANEIMVDCHAAGVPLFVKQDSGAKPGKQGRLSDHLWAFKEFPVLQGAHA